MTTENEREKAQLEREQAATSQLSRNWRLAVVDLAGESPHGLATRALRLATLQDLADLAPTVPGWRHPECVAEKPGPGDWNGCACPVCMPPLKVTP